jgi:tetratricopeptide (TPR) repeat protein
MLIFAALLNVDVASRVGFAVESPSAAALPGQAQSSYVDEEEEKAYNAARRETDPQKRVEKMWEFYQKYPKSALMQQSDFEEIKAVEEEYSAYYAAAQMPDLEKRSAMLIEFLQKYPNSKFVQNANQEYRRMLKDASQDKKYEMLESLAEKWVKADPKDKEGFAFVAEATMNLHKYDRCAEALEAVYAMQPTPSLAKEILSVYLKTKNVAKQTEWAEKILKIPELSADYMLRYDFMMRYLEEKNLAKAAEYAQLILKSAALADAPDTKSREQLRKIQRACYHVIGSNLMEKGKYAEAIAAFQKAVEAERYADGYYKIGLCLDNQKKVEDAILNYVMAELMGGGDAAKAKSRAEVLYKALHNDTLIGIDKVYKKAKELLAEPASRP